MSSTPMIELREIRKRFGSLQVLNGVSMSIASGQVTVLLGPSGSGKSTILRTINGLEGLTRGKSASVMLCSRPIQVGHARLR